MNSYPDKKLLAIDLDGTILTDAGILTPANGKALATIVADPYYVVCIATGRDVDSAVKFFSEFGITGLHVVSSGGAIIDAEDGHAWRFFPIPEPISEELKKTHLEHTIQEHRVRGTQELIKVALLNQTEEDAYWLGNEVDEGEGMDGLRADVTPILGSDLFAVDVLAEGVDKASSVEQVAWLHSIKWKDIIAIGDAENDKSMMDKASYSLCIGDRMSDCADVKFPEVEKGGFSRAIAHLRKEHDRE